MSYQSKFAGNEIDELLTQVQNGQLTIKKAFLSKKLENTGINTAFDMDIINNNGLKISNNRIILQAGKKYLIRYMIEVFNGTGTSEYGIATTLPLEDDSEQWAILYGPNISTNIGNSGERTILYTPQEDTELTFITSPYGGTPTYAWVKCTVEEFIQAGAATSMDTAPIGNIISFMGTMAPEGYLICDGSELEITKFAQLANHFETQFGAKNHFGGNGETTFALPDLRNEFLRGYHNGGEKQLSDEIGIHQDATNHSVMGAYGSEHKIFASYLAADKGEAEGLPPYGADTHSRWNDTYSMAGRVTSATDYLNGNNDTQFSHYTSRPTNVAVLFCIKYKDILNDAAKQYIEEYVGTLLNNIESKLKEV